MTRKKQIASKASTYVKDTHSPSHVSDSQAAINIAAGKAFIAGAEWADKTMLQEVLEWLDENIEIMTDSEGISFICLNYFCDTKGEVLQSFKERFNIE